MTLERRTVAACASAVASSPSSWAFAVPAAASESVCHSCVTAVARTREMPEANGVSINHVNAAFLITASACFHAVQTISSLSRAALLEALLPLSELAHFREQQIYAFPFISLSGLETNLPHLAQCPSQRLQARPLVVTPSLRFPSRLGSGLPSALSVRGFPEFTAFAFIAE